MSDPVPDSVERSPAILARQVERDFDGADGRLIRVLRGVDLRLERGETVAIVGPSGSGKWTLLHILGGLDLPTAGSIALGGSDLANLEDLELARMRNRYVGFVFQFHHLLRDFTALENVMMPQLIAGTPRAAARVLPGSAGTRVRSAGIASLPCSCGNDSDSKRGIRGGRRDGLGLDATQRPAHSTRAAQIV